jgi:hypothetical protein
MNGNLLTLVPIVVGGLLTIIGGFLSTYFLQSISRQADQRKVIRDELEAIYQLSQQVVDWAVNEMRIMTRAYTGNIDESQKSLDCPIDKLVMLVHFYQPQLNQEVQKLAINVEVFRKGLTTFWLGIAHASESKQKPSIEVLEKAIRPVDDIQKTREQFVHSVANAVQKYI